MERVEGKEGRSIPIDSNFYFISSGGGVEIVTQKKRSRPVVGKKKEKNEITSLHQLPDESLRIGLVDFANSP